MSEIKFEVRRRQKKQNFWTVRYEPVSGKILAIESGDHRDQDSLVVPFDRIKGILQGQEPQDHYLVAYDENVKGMDLVNVYKPMDFDPYWKRWLSEIDTKRDQPADIRCLILEDRILRIESSRDWVGASREDHERIEHIKIYFTEEDDPHMYVGAVFVSVAELAEHGYAERRLYSFLAPEYVDALRDGRLKMRVNLPPVAHSLSYSVTPRYFPYAGAIDDRLSVGRAGSGRDITIYAQDSTLWAKSNYRRGSPIDDITGSLRIAAFSEDPENLLGWFELPAILLRQNEPFVLAQDWDDSRPLGVLYKQSKIDIGVSV